MLVLSRRQGQRILFPDLKVSVQVVGTKGSTVRVGIEAPPNVTILREEIAPAAAPPPPPMVEKDRHDHCGRMNTLAMALHVVEKQLKAGLTADAEETLRQAQEVLESFSQAAAGPSTPPTASRLQALLVEDNPNEEALLCSYLRLNGFQVETVHDGYEALEFLAGHQRPDFLLLDMRLPRFDGPSTVAAIRQNPAYRGLRIFAVTGCSPSEFELPISTTGVDAWFQKPLNPKRIVEAMNSAAGKN